MRFVLAPDSFKESMSARQACSAMERGIRRVVPEAECISVPMADGGEGTLDALVDVTQGRIFEKSVTGPLGDEVTGRYGILGDGVTGVVELASASGLQLVPAEQRNPLLTTTFGTGELVGELVRRNIKKILVCIGGSATNDGGAGIAHALGARLLKGDGTEIGFGGGELEKLDRIDLSGLLLRRRAVEIEVACDVDNPLTGDRGASAVYGPQKGADPAMVQILDRNLKHFALKMKEATGMDVEMAPGAGAAGGVGAGLMAIFGARLLKGIDLVIQYAGLEDKVKNADLIFTGEGSIDEQTLNGKTLSGVAQLAKKYQKPLIAFAGRIVDSDALYEAGITSVFSVLPGVLNLQSALVSGEENLERTAAAVTRLILAVKS